MGELITAQFHGHPSARVDSRPGAQNAVMISLGAARRRRALRNLPRLEREVIHWRYAVSDADRLSVRELAMRLAISRSAVLRAERHGLELLRRELSAEVAA